MKKRKLIDEQGRIFGVISAVDILAVLAVAALALMAYMRFFSHTEANVSDNGFVPVNYTIKVPMIRESIANTIKVGDELWSDDGDDIGKVTNIELTPAVDRVETRRGTVELMEVEYYVDVMLSVTVDGTVNGGRYYAGRAYELGANQTLRILTKYASVNGRIWSVG